MIGKKIRFIRKKAKTSKYELSKRINKPVYLIRAWEKGNIIPTNEDLLLISKYFKISFEYLLNFEDNIKFIHKNNKIRHNLKLAQNICILISVVSLMIFGVTSLINSFLYDYELIYKVENYERKSIALELNDEYYIDVEKLMSDSSVEFDSYNLMPSQNGDYSVKKSSIIPRKIGKYNVFVELKNNRKKELYRCGIVTVYCYDINNMIKINTANDLNKINENKNGHYILCDNIDMTEFKNFASIGSFPIDEYFTGMFINPNKYIINNLTINNSTVLSGGLFGNIKDAYVDSIILKNVNINALNSNNDTIVGGLIGVARNSLITNCEVYGNVIGNYHVGGLVGELQKSTIRNCIFNGSVHQKDSINISENTSAGGLVGYMYLSDTNIKVCSIENNSIFGIVTSQYIGGQLSGFIESVFDDYSNCIQNNILDVKIDAPYIYEVGKYIS